MMTSGAHSHGISPQDEVLAAEYVLGLLSLERRQMVERRMADDADFQRHVERWQSDTVTFNDAYGEIAPDASVFNRIEQRLFADRPDNAAGSLWQSLVFWRGVSLVSSLAAVVAIVFVSGMLPPTGRQAALLVANLTAPGNVIDLAASYDASSGRLKITPVAADGGERRSLELWLVPPAGNPKSLGIINAAVDADMVISPGIQGSLGEGSVFAVSLEPFGGSPTGLPTGPIVASGTARRL
ncbi:anti-sigma factor [Agrobacterium sp. M50-1]|uniref:anti-sigma factor n=1 Tax=Agrobacterium sp. M50-1 TaxID=3132821 RepID=UPI003CE57FB5